MPWVDDEPTVAGGTFLDETPVTGGRWLDLPAGARGSPATELIPGSEGRIRVVPPKPPKPAEVYGPFPRKIPQPEPTEVLSRLAHPAEFTPNFLTPAGPSAAELLGGTKPILQDTARKLSDSFFNTPLVPFHKLNVDPQTVADALNQLASGSAELTEEEAKEIRLANATPDGMDKAVSGALAGLNDTLGSLTTPFSIFTLGGGSVLKGLAGRLLSAAFAADMARNTPEQIQSLALAIENKDPEQIARSGIGLGVGGAFLYGAAKHAATPESPAKGAAERLLDETARGSNQEQLEAAAQEFVDKAGQAKPKEPIGGHFIEPAEAEAADVSPDALKDLEATLRGNQLRRPFAQQPTAPPSEAAPEAKPAETLPVTQDMREALEFQKKTDEAVRQALANPDKKYDGMSSLELDLLAGMGDAGAIAEQRRRKETRYAEGIRSNEGQPAAPGRPAEEGEAGGGGNLQQTTPGQPEPVGARGAANAGELEKTKVEPLPGSTEIAPPKTVIREEPAEQRATVAAPIESVAEAGQTFKRGEKVFVRKKANLSKTHPATVIRDEGAEVLIRYDRTKQYETLPKIQVQEAASKAGRRAYEEQFAGQDAGERRANKAAAREFKKLVVDYGPETGWYDPTHEMAESKQQRVERDRARDTAIERAMRAIGVPANEIQANDALLAAKWLPKLKEYLSKRSGELEGAKPDRIEQALDKLKFDIKPDQLHAFGLVPQIWNGLIETVRLAYRGGKSIKEAIEHGLAWLKATHGDQKFDEAAVRRELQTLIHGAEEGEPASLRAQLRNLEAEMREHEAKGEAIPQELLDRYKTLADELGEQIRSGKEPMGADRRVDDSLEKGAPQKGAGTVPKFKGSERLPAGGVGDVLRVLNKWRRRVAERFARRGEFASISAGRDAADNAADRGANMAAGTIRHALNRIFGEKPSKVTKKNDIREAALSFVVESDALPISEAHALIASSPVADTTWGRRALRALEYAHEHFDKLAKLVEAYKNLNRMQREEELNRGVVSGEWKDGNYLHHSWSEAPATDLGVSRGVDPTKPSSAPTGFTQHRTHPTLAEGIAAGGIPRTMSAIELLSKRIGEGQRKLNELAWLEGLRDMPDPIDGQPIATDVMWKPGAPKEVTAGTATENMPAQWHPEAPDGYSVQRFGDTVVAIKDGYAGLLTDLTSKSWLRGGGFRESVQKGFALAKHFLLLFDTMHPMWVLFNRLPYGGDHLLSSRGFKRGLSLLDNTPAELRLMAERGEIPHEWLHKLEADHAALKTLEQAGYNIGGISDNIFADWVHKLPITGAFNHWAFNQFIRGAMAEAGLIELNRMRKLYPGAADADLARTVSSKLNARFGNLGRQGLFKSKTAQDIARLIALAPQFNESLARSEIGSAYELARLPDRSIRQGRPVVGSLLRSVGTLALGMFAANQIINLATRGKPTWENEEEGFEAKMSAWIPDFVGSSKGFFLNPLAIPMRLTTLVADTLHQTQGDVMEAGRRVLMSRMTAPTRALTIGATRRTGTGRALRGSEVLPAMLDAVTPLPISASAVGHGVKQVATGQPSEEYPGQFQRQIASSVGVHLKTAPSPEQRVAALAREFNGEKGIEPSAEFFSGDFDDLNKALRIGNENDARSALEELLKKKTPKQIAEHYQRWARAPFTGQQRREREFYNGLEAEQKAAYTQGRKDRATLAIRARELLRQAVAR